MAFDPEVMHIFATKLKYYMDREHITGNEIAARTGSSIGSVSNWLHEVNEPRMSVVYELTKIFNCTLSDLLEGKIKDPHSEEHGSEGGRNPLLDQLLKEAQDFDEDTLRAVITFMQALKKNLPE